MRRIASEELLDYDRFIKRIAQIQKKYIAKNIIITGDGLEVCAPLVKQALPRVAIADKDLWYPQPYSMVLLAKEHVQQHKAVHPFKIEPRYLYPQDCQIRIPSIRRQGKR